MTIILYLLAVSLTVAACGLGTFLWSLRTGQYDDLDGAANRILFDDDTPPNPTLPNPTPPRGHPSPAAHPHTPP